jgi:hypothetical protein
MEGLENNEVRLHEIEYTQKEILKKLTSIEDRLVEAEKLTKGIVGLYTTLKVIGSVAGVVAAVSLLWAQFRSGG